MLFHLSHLTHLIDIVDMTEHSYQIRVSHIAFFITIQILLVTRKGHEIFALGHCIGV